MKKNNNPEDTWSSEMFWRTFMLSQRTRVPELVISHTQGWREHPYLERTQVRRTLLHGHFVPKFYHQGPQLRERNMETVGTNASALLQS